jgi:hypothetical protein
LSTVEPDRKFTTKYPNLRQGPHALITVTEVRGPVRVGGPLGLRDEQAGSKSGKSPSDQPGVDLGTLQGLIRECGGHLWMRVEPPGDMVVKIHLPLRASDESASPRPSVVRTGGARATGRWFQH